MYDNSKAEIDGSWVLDHQENSYANPDFSVQISFTREKLLLFCFKLLL